MASASGGYLILGRLPSRRESNRFDSIRLERPQAGRWQQSLLSWYPEPPSTIALGWRDKQDPRSRVVCRKTKRIIMHAVESYAVVPR